MPFICVIQVDGRKKMLEHKKFIVLDKKCAFKGFEYGMSNFWNKFVLKGEVVLNFLRNI